MYIHLCCTSELLSRVGYDASKNSVWYQTSMHELCACEWRRDMLSQPMLHSALLICVPVGCNNRLDQQHLYSKRTSQTCWPLLCAEHNKLHSKGLSGGQKHTAEASFQVRSKLRNHLQQKQGIVDNTVIACTYDTESLIRQTGNVTFVIGQQNSLFSAGTLTASGL